MARRLTLLAVLACAALAINARVVRRPIPNISYSSESDVDPFVLIDEYDSLEPLAHPTTTRPPRRTTTKPNTKVIIRAKGPKVNGTVKHTKSENKKQLVKTTTINIESHTNLIVTEKPPRRVSVVKHRPVQYEEVPMVPVSGEYVWVEEQPAALTVRPQMVRRPAAPRPPAATTPRPRTTTRRATTPKPRTTRRFTPKTTKKPKTVTKKPTTTACPPKNSAWLSSFFNEDKKKKKQNKPSTQGWFVGFLSRVYNWIWGPTKGDSAGWFGGTWFQGEMKKTKPMTTTTTPRPVLTTTSNWFHNLLNSEEEDAIVANVEAKKSIKKSGRKSYKGYQLLRVYPDVQWKVHEMMDLKEEADGSGLMWWTQPSLNGSTDLLVPPDILADIKDHLKSSNIDFDVIIWDLDKAIMYENPKLSKKQRMELELYRGHPMTWRRYHRYSDMLRYLEYIQHSYSDYVELIPLGRSSEGLPLVIVKVSLPSNGSYAKGAEDKKKKWMLKSRMKPAVLVEGGAHAREWIAPAVAMWILHTLVEGEKDLGPDLETLKQADFFIMPVLNPDGYEYSHTHDRLWHKTRSRHSEEGSDDYMSWLPWNWGSSDCVGVDPDRNWDFHWGEKDSPKDACADHYGGPHPFSEPETRAVSAFLAEHRDLIQVYVSLHAYSQAWLMPSSHSHAPYADDGQLMEMGKLAAAALADLYGTKYQVGSIAELRQPASGMAHDWAKARAGVKYSYHVDLRDSFGPYGFLLPGSQITSTARETWHAIKAIVDNLTPG